MVKLLVDEMSLQVGHGCLSPGIHVLSNANPDIPWPKAQRLSQNFRDLLDIHGESEIYIKEMVEKLMTNTVKDEEGKLPHIYPPKEEYQLSSFFVEMERPSGCYGTRSTSALSVKSTGDVCFYARYLDKDLWKEQTVTYLMQE